MLNKVQKYMLLHHPLIWNIRLVPMMLILIIVNLFFFAIGFFTTDAGFTDDYYGSIMSDFGMFYMVCVLVGVLLFVGWQILYARNNAFKSFYPRRAHQVYLEWFLVFTITLGMTAIAASLVLGGMYRWQSRASQEEAKEVLEKLQQIEVLLPYNLSEYKYDSEHYSVISVPKDSITDLSKVDLDNYSFEYMPGGRLMLKGYVGPSLLYFSKYYRGYNVGYDATFDRGSEYYYNNTKEGVLKHKQNVLAVKNWLHNGDKQSLTSLMDYFFALHEKHDLSYDLTKEAWMRRIYNPPYFAVDRNTFIKVSKAGTSFSYYNDYAYTYDDDGNAIYDESTYYPYVQFKELQSGYENILKSYEDMKDTRILFLVCLSLALMLSVFVISFRATSGKTWLIALVSIGLSMFISIVLAVLMADNGSDDGAAFLFVLFWIGVFSTSLFVIISKIKDRGNKGKSIVFVNIFLWMIPFLVPLFFFGYHIVLELGDGNNLDEENIETMFWINIIFSIVVMYPAMRLVHRWKNIPEE